MEEMKALSFRTISARHKDVKQCFPVHFCSMKARIPKAAPMPSSVVPEPAVLAKLDEVADLAGVSPATVSRVFNHPHLVAESTQERVRKAVIQLGFVPNSAARALSRGRTRLIGALIPTIGYSIYADYMESVQESCGAADYSLVMGVYQFNADKELEQARRLVDAGVEGLLLVGFKHDPQLFELIAVRRIPYVCTSVHNARSPHPNVGYDNVGAGKKVVDCLLQLGHRKFGVVTGFTETNDRMAMRLTGIRSALRKAGLDLPASAVYEGDYSLIAGREGFRQVHGAHHPTAVICGNDVIALGAIQGAGDAGLRVPTDVSVIGFDGLEWVNQFSPALTTVRVPMDEMGDRAARALIARIEGEPVPHAVQVPVQLIENQSSGAASGLGLAA